MTASGGSLGEEGGDLVLGSAAVEVGGGAHLMLSRPEVFVDRVVSVAEPAGRHRQLVHSARSAALIGWDLGMDASAGLDGRFRGYRFPAILIGEVVWLRFRSSAP
jgi:hypothetical protein